MTPTLDAMLDALAHRGPDGHGTHFAAGRRIGLGHRRLSIIDLDNGAQPMANETHDVWVVFNGEIYNHRDLRRQLEAQGHVFRTHADTEVLIHGWEQWEEALLPRLNGIFAAAIYDERGADGQGARGQLVLFRDPVGVKPLYVGQTIDRLWFASELQAARAAGLLSPLRPEGIAQYLVYRFIPSPDTIYAGVHKVPPGHLLRLDVAKLPARLEWKPFEPIWNEAARPSTTSQWEGALRDGLSRAVQRQLMSDVPVASMLSGGVDSTVITRLMTHGLGHAPQAFTVGFSDARIDNEIPVARRAATALGVPLTELALTENDFIPMWPQLIARMSEPISNSGAPLIAALSREVGKTHKVVLTGQGADEPLGGYPRHTVERWVRWARPLRHLVDRLPESLAGSDRVARVRRIIAADDEAERFAQTLAVFSPAEAMRLVRGDVRAPQLVAPVRRWAARARGADPFSRLLQVDTRMSLADDLLAVADLTSMAASVELRVPFLDLELLCLAESMPSKYKVSLWGERKWLYRRAVREIVPAQLHTNLTGLGARLGRKLGFSTPLEAWYPRWLQNEAAAYLTGKDARLPHYLRADPTAAFVRSVREQGIPRQRQMLALYVLETWLRSVEA